MRRTIPKAEVSPAFTGRMRAAAAVTEEDKPAAQTRIRRLCEGYVELSKKAGLRTQIDRANLYQPKEFTNNNSGAIIANGNISDIFKVDTGRHRNEAPLNEARISEAINAARNDMIKVHDVIKMGEKKTVLLCEYFDPQDFNGELYTNVGVVAKPEYSIAEPTECFSPQNTTAILIEADMDCSRIRFVDNKKPDYYMR